MRLATAFICLLLVQSISATGMPLHVQSEGERQVLLQLGIEPDMKVGYFDAQGSTISFHGFMKRLAKGNSFNTTKNVKDREAFLRFDGKPRVAIVHPRLSLDVGLPIPAIDVLALDGTRFSNKLFDGHFTLINFFFSNCAPCVREIPILEEVKRDLPAVSVLAITFDDRKTASEFTQRLGFTWLVLPDLRKFLDDLGVKEYPMLALIGPDGRLVGYTLSDSLDKRQGAVTAQAIDDWVNQQIVLSQSPAPRP